MEEIGGTLRAIDLNYFQREIAEFAYNYATRKASGERAVIGVNKYVDEGEEHEIQTHKTDPGSEQRKIEQLRNVKRTRDNELVQEKLARLREAARDPATNLIPATIEAVRAKLRWAKS